MLETLLVRMLHTPTRIVSTTTIAGHSLGGQRLMKGAVNTDTDGSEMSFSRRITGGLAALTLVAVACGGGAKSEDTTTNAAAVTPTSVAGDPAPSRAFELFDGSPATLADFKGQPVVLNFWASWCPSCVAEMSAAFRPVQERIGAEVTFLGMNIQDDRGLADSLLEETGIDWVNAVDPVGELYLDLGGLAMPFTVFIDAAGNILDAHNGPLNKRQLADRISELFGVTA